MNKKYFFGIISLFVAAACWGSGHAFVKLNTGIFSPQWLVALRLGIAGMLMAILGFPKWKKLDWIQAKHGMKMGFIMYWVYALFAVGVQYTASSRASFILGCYIVFVPVVYWIIHRRKPLSREFAASFICLVGVSVILFDGAGGGLNIGDLCIAVEAIFYALHVVYSALYAKDADTLLLNMIQLVTAGVFAVCIALITSSLPQRLVLSDFSGPLYLALVSTIFPYMCSLYGQKFVKTATSAVILSFESVFGILSAVLLLGETLSLRFVVGAGIVMYAFFVVEGKFSLKEKK